MLRLGTLLRLAIPVLLTLARATVIARVLLLLFLALSIGRFLFLSSRLIGRRYNRPRKAKTNGKKVIDGSYKIVDEEEPHP